MNNPTIRIVLSLLAILLTPNASATYYYDTDDIQQRVINEAKRQNMSASLALAIAKVESNFNPKALSHAGAKGVMQIMPRTAEQGFGVPRSRLFDPDVNIALGVTFIKKLLKRYDGRLDIALSHYNGGSGVKNKYGELKVMPATRNYVDKVLATQQDFLQHDSNLPRHNPSSFAAHSEDLQIETLRALRLHNITRNYPSKRARLFTNKSSLPIKSPAVQATLDARIAKVRQWESIY